MRKRRNVIFPASFVILTIVVSAILLGLLQAYRERTQAQRMLGVLQQIQVGITDKATVLQLTSPFRDHMVSRSTKDQLGFAFYNRWLGWLGLAPYAHFWVRMDFEDSVVVLKSASEMVSNTGCVASVQESKKGLFIPNGFRSTNHIVAYSDLPPQQFVRIRIENDVTYDEAKRRKDWNFDFSCMTTIGTGCSDARKMLPDATSERPTFESGPEEHQ